MAKEKSFDAIVIGGGPAGMMAAGRASERGGRILLLERNSSLGRKLLISGKGRCNITNAGDVDVFIENFGRNGRFLRNAFSRVFNDDLRRFFEEKGVPLKVERGKRVFPASDRSKDILDALKRYLKENRAVVRFDSEVVQVKCQGSGKEVVLRSGEKYTAEAVAICTGGVSYPETGSAGFGFEAAEMLGHTVLPAAPALVGLVTESAVPRSWSGIALKNVEASLVCGRKRLEKRFGEMLFTHFGLSGPIILDMSAQAFDLLKSKNRVDVSIDLKPALDRSTLDKRFIREFTGHPDKILSNILPRLLPHSMAAGFIRLCGIDPTVRVNQVTKEQRRTLIERLSDMRFGIKATRPVEEAIVTRGGVETKEIDPKTMESRLRKGLFFAGEVIDVDARTGGYNMQAAFSTGYLCGDNI